MELPNPEEMAGASSLVHFRLMPPQDAPKSRNLAIRTGVLGRDLVLVSGIAPGPAIAAAQLANFAYKLGRIHGEQTKK